jgi:hypothetical protein
VVGHAASVAPARVFGGDTEGGATETELWTTVQLGYGLSERFSAYLNGTVSSDAFLRSRDKALRLGLYANPLDTRLFDLDLMFEFRLFGSTLSATREAKAYPPG